MNTKTRRILSVLLVLCMSFALMATAFAADAEAEDVAKIKLTVSALGAKTDMTITAKAEVSMTEEQAKTAAAMGAAALAEKEFVCTLSDSAKFLDTIAEQVKAAKITINEDSIFEMKSSDLKDGVLTVTYKIKADALKNLSAEALKNKLVAEKAVVSAVVEKVAIDKDVESTVSAVACLGTTVLAKGETDVTLGADMVFTDVASDAYFAAPVLWAVKNKITVGTTATTFSPYKDCTRAQIVTFLYRYNGSQKATSQTNPFTDVPSTAYYYDAVLWAVENGVTVGTTKTTFSPDASCTREQFVTFLWRFDGSKEVKAENPFKDVAADAYYYNAVMWAVDNGVTVGMRADTFGTGVACSRAHVVTFLYRYDGLEKAPAADDTAAKE